MSSQVSVAKSLDKPVFLYQQHWHFDHVESGKIEEALQKELLDGLEVKLIPNEETKVTCEDCIMGKRSTCPHDTNVKPETELLALVYIDLWGPSTVKSAGGVLYIMILTDNATSFQKVYFLATKNTEGVIRCIKEYQTEGE